MSDRLARSTELLRQHYGNPPSLGNFGMWSTVVAVVVSSGLRGDRTRVDTLLARMDESALGNPRDCSQADVEEIARLLEKIPHRRKKAVQLKGVAAWWTQRFDAETSVDWNAGLDELRHELLGIRGVGLELADRLLLFVGGLPAFPVGRSTMRIVCRHDWLGPESEYEEWQTFLVDGLERSTAALQKYAWWSEQVGTDFCGPAPHCDECPLKPLLPADGPREPDD